MLRVARHRRWALLLILALGAHAADDQLAVLAQRLQRVESASGSFIQETRRSDDAAAPPARLQGRFAMRAPAAYDLVYTRPGDPEWRQRFVSDGVTSWEIEVTESDLPPDVQAHPAGARDAHLRRILAALRGDLDGLAKDFRLSATVLEGGWRLALAPLTPELAEDVTRIAITLDAQAHPTQVVVEERGALITATVLAVDYDVPLADGRFTR